MRKKEDKKIAFLLTFLLVVGIFLIYANLKFTGLVTNIDSITNETECVAANYTWENLTECDNILSDCVECVDEESCQETCEYCEEAWGCIGNICGDGEVQTPNDNGVNEVCDDGENNGEYDYCAIDCLSEGSYCGDGIINGNEECDGSDLGTYTCESEGFDGGTLTCDSDCTINDNECSNDENDEDSDNEEIPTTTVITSNAVTESSCAPNWECGEWTECVSETQDRICTDINQCGSNEGMPETSQSCVVEIKETCSDGIKNQGEAGIDCGGPCEDKCSIFTIVGSAISGPVGAGKDFVLKGMFGSKTKIIISVSVLVLVAGIVVAFVLFKKGILKLPLKNSSKKEVKTQEM